jgi:hypothetical protein
MRLGQQIEAGMVMVNGIGFGFELAEGATEEPPMSFWGTAGWGEDGPPDRLINFFTGNRVVGINGRSGEGAGGSGSGSGGSGGSGGPGTSMIISSGIRVQVKNNFRKKYYQRLRLVV